MRIRDERAATLVEYVLFVSGFVLIAITAVGGMNTVARSYFQQSSSRIGQPVNRIQYDANGNRQQQASTTSITAPPSTATTTTVAPTTTRATTTVAPTTTAAPTTTRATTTLPPTTTTTTSTTTTTVPKKVATSISNTSVDSGSTWTFRVVITVTGTGGAAVNNLTVSAVGKFNGDVVGTLSCTTAANGQCTITYPNVPDYYSPIIFEITGVSGANPWTGATKSLTVYDP